MSALVPYTAGLIQPGSAAQVAQAAKILYGNKEKLKMAYKAARSTYKAGTKIANWGKKAYTRRYAGKKNQSQSARLRKVADDTGFDIGKKTALNGTLVSLSTKSLNFVELTSIAHTSLNEIDSRQRNIIDCSGFKICMFFTNKKLHPVYLNVAVVCPKNPTSGVSNVNFFRGYGTSRAADFVATNMDGQMFNCTPINDDLYVVLRHQRYVIAGTGDATYNSQTPNYLYINFYQKFNRQLRFDFTSDTSPYNGRCYLVHWFALVDEALSGTPQASAMDRTYHIVQYFKEPGIVG